MPETRSARDIVQKAIATGGSQIVQVGRDYYAAGASALVAPPVSLPPSPPSLVGRDAQVEELLALLSPNHSEQQPGTTVITVTGLPGVGKTALALYTAHQAREVRDWFDGGILYADLRGYDAADHLTADQVLTRWLHELGTRDASMPTSTEERIDHYRAMLYRLAEAGERVLLIADNASSTEQIQPLIPPRTEHRLIVTSRDSLVSLPARQLMIVHLDPAPATDLIAAQLRQVQPGDTRPSAEPAALADLANRCGGLPIALKIVAQVLARDPGLPIGRLAEAVAAETASAKQVTGILREAYGAFAVSYQRLAPEAAHTFRLLALNVGPGTSTEAAAALTDQPMERIRAQLSVLAQASLITEQMPGSGWWVMHDLVHAYAADCVARDCTEQAREDALDRLLQQY